MSFSTPIPALLAAGLVLPLLLLLYFLKLRRAPRRIASTLLWQRAVRDLQVNAPFQRLRPTLLLFLQLLIALFLLFALAGPILEGDNPESSRLIILIDRSASMNATDTAPAHPSRLEAAKDVARELVRRLDEGAGERAAMVITFGARPQVISGYETSAARLIEAINAIEPTDETADFEAALRLAEAFAGSTDEDAAALPSVVLLSDGGVAESGERGQTLRAGEFRFVRVGPALDAVIDNIGIVALEARRAFDDPALVEVFANLVNAGTEPRSVGLTFRLDDRVLRVESVTIPGALERVGEAPAAMSFRYDGGGVITASLTHGDALATDDVASLVLDPPLRPRIVVVTPDGSLSVYTEAMLRVFDMASIRVLSANDPETERLSLPAIADTVDFVIHDGVAPRLLPAVASLTFGAAPVEIAPRADEPATERRAGGQRVLSWDRRHALMRNVELDDLIFANPARLVVPDHITTLALGPEGAVMALVRADERPHVVIAFTLAQSNWPILPSLLVLMQNMLEHAGLHATGAMARSTRPGEPITITPRTGATEVRVVGPQERRLRVNGERSITVAALSRVGLYRIEGVRPEHASLAVNLASEAESDIRPREQLRVNAEDVIGARADRAAPRDLWPWFVLAAFVVFVIEWLIYAGQSRV